MASENNEALRALVQGTRLMEANRADIVAALNAVGIAEATAETPLSELADLIQWATGLAEIKLATLELATGSQAFFRQSEWEAMTSSQRSAYLSLGVLFRAHARQWIIAKANATDSTNAATYVWSSEQVDVPNLKNYEVKSTGFLSDFDGEGKTDTVCTYAETAGNSYPAAQVCRAYSAGEGDTSVWYCPDVSQWMLMNRYFNEIQDKLYAFFGVKMSTDYYWTIDECNSSTAWRCVPGGGVCVDNNLKYSSYVKSCLRACCRVAAM